MSSSTLPHTCSRTGVCSCSYEIERFSESNGNARGSKSIKRTSPALPDDVKAEILLRLPAKTLLQLRHIGRIWYNLIRSPSFISMHYTVHRKKEPSLLCDSYDRRGRPVISFPLSDIPVDVTDRFCHDQPEIVGCSYGLVCISLFRRSHNKFVIWNPATGFCRKIDMIYGFFRSAVLMTSGFHFDYASNTHRVVRVTNLSKWQPFGETTTGGGTRMLITVFTLSENTWIEKELVVPYEFSRGMNISEVTRTERYLFWVLKFNNEKFILGFDMVDELFRRIEFPCLGHPHCSTDLTEYRGSLAMFVWATKNDFSSLEQSFDVWLLNGCGGDKESWSKQLTLRPSLAIDQAPLGFFTKGEEDFVVLSTDGGYFLWNSDSGETTKVLCKDVNLRQIFLYSESLASAL